MKAFEESARKWIAEESRYIPSIPPIRVYQEGWKAALEWALTHKCEYEGSMPHECWKYIDLYPIEEELND